MPAFSDTAGWRGGGGWLWRGVTIHNVGKGETMHENCYLIIRMRPAHLCIDGEEIQTKLEIYTQSHHSAKVIYVS